MLKPSEAIELLIAAGCRKVDINNEQPHLPDIVLADTIEAKAAELISFYQRRVDDLLVANTRYLERARDAEREIAGVTRDLTARGCRDTGGPLHALVDEMIDKVRDDDVKFVRGMTE